jgi:hypothetical protein
MPVPQDGAVNPQSLAVQPQNSYSDRATQCMQIGTAAGLGSGVNSAYAAECASQ